MISKLRQLGALFASVATLTSLTAFAVESDTGKVGNAASVQTQPAQLVTAIFVRNTGGKDLNSEIDTFNNTLSSKLTDKGFAIMDWNDIVQKFTESNETEDNIYKYTRSFMAVATTTQSNDSVTAFTEKTKSSEPQDSMTEKTKAGGITKSSSLRISQMLGAKYLIVATMGHLGHEKRIFKGEDTMYKTNNQVDIYTMPMTVRVLDGDSGQSIYGDTLVASTQIYQNASIEIVMNNIIDKLIDSGTALLADNIAKKINQIRAAALQLSTPVQFSIDCNVKGATAELDGAAIGSPPAAFSAKPGLHQLRITREYFVPWEQTVNIYANQKLTISLEFTTEGQAKYKDLTAFNQAQELEKARTYAEIGIAEQQSQADADVKENVSSGQEVFLKNSYIRSDGFAQQLEYIIHGNR
ncbi:MAG: PEGA domain-containing protein [Lentisphaerota bacterium]